MGASYSSFMIAHIRRYSLLSSKCFQAFYKDMNKYDRINELSYFKCSLVSRINKLKDTVIELGSKDIPFYLRKVT